MKTENTREILLEENLDNFIISLLPQNIIPIYKNLTKEQKIIVRICIACDTFSKYMQIVNKEKDPYK